MRETESELARAREREVGASAMGVLVNQFKNPYDFVRELVQNSLDSGTHEVSVWTDYKPTGEDAGLCEIHVDDFGEGMDEEIIDNRLTCLFSSSKEGDSGKIGKFGIGFVSVFAIDPEAIIVRTCRGGKSWEVFFGRDRSFEKSTIGDSFRGTRVTVFKGMSPGDYADAVGSVKQMLDFWCRHAETTIYFQDKYAQVDTDESQWGRPAVRKERVNAEAQIEGFLPIRFEDGETSVNMAFCDSPTYGFYNRGLTLTETGAPEVVDGYHHFFGSVSFKIKSPLLEHTLTRDTILRDENYHRAMMMLVDGARRRLVDELLEYLEARASSRSLSGDGRDEYLLGLGWLLSLPRALDPTFKITERLQDLGSNLAASMGLGGRSHDERSVGAAGRKVFHICGEGACDFGELDSVASSTRGILFWSQEEGPATEAIARAKGRTLLAPRTEHVESFLHSHLTGEPGHKDKLPRIAGPGDGVWLGERKDAKESSRLETRLLEQLDHWMKEVGLTKVTLVPTRLIGVDDSDAVVFGVLGKRDVVLGHLKLGEQGAKADLAVNTDGEAFKGLLGLYRSKPELAVFIAIKRLALECVQAGPLERQLVAYAMEKLS